jgi:RimJ/RimL family protein N-acetyltransferase
VSRWPAGATITSARLVLRPVEVAHAEEMVEVLGDPRLYEFTGGEPPTLPALRERYERWQRPTSPDGTEGWLNWIVFRRADDAAVGTVQATVTVDGAEVAWVIGVPFQRNGFAAEAAVAAAEWLATDGVTDLRAHVAIGHTASERVAAALGMAPTDVLVDGERRWVLRDTEA